MSQENVSRSALDSPTKEQSTSTTKSTCPHCLAESLTAMQSYCLTSHKTSVQLITFRSSGQLRVALSSLETLGKLSTPSEEQTVLQWIRCDNCGLTGLIFHSLPPFGVPKS